MKKFASPRSAAPSAASAPTRTAIQRPRRGHANEVRLIGGQWKRSKLPVADSPGLRPTPDRVRETLFNWLGQDLAGWRVLDAFAGTGVLGFEAASRGAAQVLLIERDPALVLSLEAVKKRLAADAVTVLRSDAIAWMLRAAPASLELVLLDPPFDAGLASSAVAAAAKLLVPSGYLYLEASEPLADAPAGLELHRSLRAGAVNVQLWRAPS